MTADDEHLPLHGHVWGSDDLCVLCEERKDGPPTWCRVMYPTTPRILFFGSWVRARQWALEFHIPKDSIILASDGERRIRGLRKQIIFVRSGPASESERDRWLRVAESARYVNQTNGFETKVVTW